MRSTLMVALIEHSLVPASLLLLLSFQSTLNKRNNLWIPIEFEIVGVFSRAQNDHSLAVRHWLDAEDLGSSQFASGRDDESQFELVCLLNPLTRESVDEVAELERSVPFQFKDHDLIGGKGFVLDRLAVCKPYNFVCPSVAFNLTKRKNGQHQSRRNPNALHESILPMPMGRSLPQLGTGRCFPPTQTAL